jgi:hypothetical protein
MDNQQDPNSQAPHQPGSVFAPQSTADLIAAPVVSTPAPQPVQEPQSVSQPQVFPQDSAIQPAPTLMSTPSAPASNTVGFTPPQTKRKIKGIVILILAMLVIGGGGAFALLVLHKSPSAALNCTPPAASSLDKTTAVGVYTSFAEAVKQSNQSCADSLSSNYFKQQQAQVFPGSNGKWVTMREGGLASVADRLSKLPMTLSSSSFTQSDYTEAIAEGSINTTAPVQGITLTYPLNGANDVQYHLNISLILQSGKVVVDNLELKPASLDTQSTSDGSQRNSTGNSSSSLNPADAKTLAGANVSSIATYLEIYFSDTNSYPSDINASSFAAQGPNVDQTVFTAPTGTKYVYTPTPSGCTTAAKNCQHFTLSVVSIGDSSTIVSKQSVN